MTLIDADKYFNLIVNAKSAMQCIEKLHSMPAVDAVPAEHGHWIDKPTGRYGQWQSWCSVCGKHSGIGGIESNRHKPFCPNCGSKMNLDSEIMHEVTE